MFLLKGEVSVLTHLGIHIDFEITCLTKRDYVGDRSFLMIFKITLNLYAIEQIAIDFLG